MRATVKMHRDTNGKPDWSQALPGMVFDWDGTPYLIVSLHISVRFPEDTVGKIHGINLRTGQVSWLWSKETMPAGWSAEPAPTFLGYATDIEITVQQEEPS